MKTLVFLTLFLMLGGADNNDLLRTRELYYKASLNETNAEAFDDYLSTSPDIERSLLAGYWGVCFMLKANHVWNPYSKLSYFNKGKDMLNEAIVKAPAQVELRFLRFCVQTNVPAFLGYKTDIPADKALILKKYSSLEDEDLKTRIKNYLGASAYCSASEKQLLK